MHGDRPKDGPRRAFATTNCYGKTVDRRAESRGKPSLSRAAFATVFDIHIGLIDEAEQEFDIAIAIIRFKWKHADAEYRKELAGEEVAVRQDRAQNINDAYRLTADLRGQSYVDQDIPPRLQIVSSVRKKRSKPKQEPVEVQLSLF